MTPKQLIAHYGNKTKAAAELGLSERCIVSWDKSKKRPQIPIWSQHAIANISGGALKVDEARK